ncbi:hypothetical protein [Lignipirellula cremea]|uniref:Uncharacterized protein n=1 Tax=Lignipirellula cremea TaxID=2528010 RepID=A0A518DY82_9BACT|nr:hypothetical protein [Lignipirellula cremea]QDU96809.1 hypothetical protein Pla8534_46300 [Lignipirellula cremea]
MFASLFLPRTVAAWLVLAAILLALPATTIAQEPSLDKQVLEDLDLGDDDLLEGLDDLPLRPPTQPTQPQGDNPAELAGEDLGQELENPLLRIGQRMRQAETRISQRDTSQQTQQLQQDIVADLAKLIEQMQQQPPPSGGQSSPKPQPAPQPGQEQPKQGEGDQQASSQPQPGASRESSDRMDKSDKAEAGSEHLDLLIKKVWGHLPPRVQQQMQNVQEEQATPGFEKLIYEYYKRLAEDGSVSP